MRAPAHGASDLHAPAVGTLLEHSEGLTAHHGPTPEAGTPHGTTAPDRGPANLTPEQGAADPGRVGSKDDPTVTSAPDAEPGKTYTQAEVDQAWKDASRDAVGNPVDHRTGHPLVETRADDGRGWHMTGDPDNRV